ncbi:cation:proton antiporter [Streptomyces sp. NPDC048523]|uniref:cation:proton antiporter n=1 Tax=Streptomyces sp. NPDC048523 TaxID=3365567 RepID=UPI00371041FF
MSAWAVFVVAAVVAGYALVSARAAAWAVSGPMIFVAVGTALGEPGLGLVSPAHDVEPVRALLEAALALVLFTDAAGVHSRELRRDDFLPVRLLGIGLPLTIGLGWLAAWPLLPGLGVWGLALVGTILAPTDAALGQPAITDRRVPALVRQGLNVESGLNDGLCVPFFVLFLAAAGQEAGRAGTPGAGEVVVRALLLSTVCGIGLGLPAGWALVRSRRRGWAAGEWRQLLPAMIAFGSFAAAAALEGSGFIAAWVAGLAYGNAVRRHPTERGTPDPECELTERLGALLAMLSFFAFGALLLAPALNELTWRMAVYAVLSLTVIRGLPVALSLARSGLRPPTVAYVAWFGPRGLASIVLGLLVLEERIPGTEQVSAVVALTVTISVYAHGVSAGVLAGRYGRWYRAAAARTPGLREDAPASSDGTGIALRG